MAACLWNLHQLTKQTNIVVGKDYTVVKKILLKKKKNLFFPLVP